MHSRVSIARSPYKVNVGEEVAGTFLGSKILKELTTSEEVKRLEMLSLN